MFNDNTVHELQMMESALSSFFLNAYFQIFYVKISLHSMTIS